MLQKQLSKIKRRSYSNLQCIFKIFIATVVDTTHFGSGVVYKIINMTVFADNLLDKFLKRFFICKIIINLAASFAHPVTPSLIVERNLDSSMFGVALAAMQTTYFLLAPFWGKLNNYLSTRWMMLICCTGYAVGQIVFMSAQTEAVVIAGRAFSGMFTGGLFTAMLNYLINVSDPETRGKNLTIYATIQTVGSACGYFIGGMLGTISTETAFIAQIITLLVGGVLLCVTSVPDAKGSLRDMQPRQFIKEANPEEKPALKATPRWKPMLSAAACFALVALAGIGTNAFEQCFNYYIRDQFGLGSMYNGAIKAVIAVIGVVANSTVCMWLMKKTDIHRSFLPVMVACGAAVLTITIPTAVVPYFAIAVVYFALNTVRTPLVQNMAASRASKEHSNLVMGFYNSMNSLGGIFGALFAGLMYNAGPKLPFIFGGCAFLLASLLGAFYIRVSKKYPLPKAE